MLMYCVLDVSVLVVYRMAEAEVRCLRGVCGRRKWLGGVGGGSRKGSGKETLMTARTRTVAWTARCLTAHEATIPQ